jgi:1-deoxy-D-xylulose-5-phosphate reductoisomerase
LKKKIAILGSTGSIGEQTLNVIQQHPDRFEVEVLTANENVEKLTKQAIEFQPNIVVIANESKYSELSKNLESTDIKVFAGKESLADIVEMDSVDVVLNALVGFSGLIPTIRAARYNKQIALANKETLVVGGNIIMREIKESKSSIIPVDSEHSAIFQCLMGELPASLKKIILTASGGPFRTKEITEFKNITPKQALKHPNWNMGAKVSIDSATMMNKGLEVIEARWLFGLGADKIDVVVHPQSIVHSMVVFEDNSIKAQLGHPDMRLPIQFALSYPERLASDFKDFDFTDYPSLNFEKPDVNKFPNLQLAYDALRKGGNMSCILNAANEIAVEAFLKEKISFIQITNLIEYCMNHITFVENPTIEDLIETDKQCRNSAVVYINK